MRPHFTTCPVNRSHPPVPDPDMAVVTILGAGLEEAGRDTFNLLVMRRGRLDRFLPVLMAIDSDTSSAASPKVLYSSAALATSLVGFAYTFHSKQAPVVILLPCGDISNLHCYASAANRYIFAPFGPEPSEGDLMFTHSRRDRPLGPFEVYERGLLREFLARCS